MIFLVIARLFVNVSVKYVIETFLGSLGHLFFNMDSSSFGVSKLVISTPRSYVSMSL